LATIVTDMWEYEKRLPLGITDRSSTGGSSAGGPSAGGSTKSSAGGSSSFSSNPLNYVTVRSVDPTSSDDPKIRELCAFALSVCEAVGIVIETGHVEVKLTERGPVLVEVGDLPSTPCHTCAPHPQLLVCVSMFAHVSVSVLEDVLKTVRRAGIRKMAHNALKHDSPPRR
jgi:hypothetical protein